MFVRCGNKEVTKTIYSWSTQNVKELFMVIFQILFPNHQWNEFYSPFLFFRNGVVFLLHTLCFSRNEIWTSQRKHDVAQVVDPVYFQFCWMISKIEFLIQVHASSGKLNYFDCYLVLKDVFVIGDVCSKMKDPVYPR